MKIAFFVSIFPQLSETFVLNQIYGLLDRGHDVQIFARVLGDTEKYHPEMDTYGLMDRCCILEKQSNRSKLLFDTGPTVFAQMVKHPVQVFRALSASGHRINRTLLLSAVSLLLEKGPFDILHCHFGPNGIFAAKLRQLGIPGKLVTIFHGYDMTSFVQRRGADVYRELFTTGDLFLPISHKWHKRLLELGGRPDTIQVHRVGVDPQKFKFTKQRIRPGEIRILSVARLVEKKGIELGIRAVAQLKKQSPELGLKYMIAGNGPLMDRIEALIHELGCEETVHLLGWQDQDQVEQLMHTAHILLVPSVTGDDGDQEGIPVVMMEALAKGIVVCASRNGCISELVTPDYNGYLFPEGDVEAIRRTLKESIDSQACWPEIRQNGRDTIKREYDVNRLNDELVTLFQNTLMG